MQRRFEYRRDIDGLRGIAILLVLAFHAFPSRVPGGFVGVDVFFAVSGYLITGIVLAAEADGAFSFRRFYANRVRRLVPALTVVLAVVLGAGALLLRPDEFARLGEHTAAGGVFVSNLVLWREGGYFSAGPLLRPLLHLWSLGIEEQFYLLWPALILIASRRRLLRPAIVAISAASFLLSIGMLRTDYVGAFYVPWTRLWELSLGGLLATYAVDRPSPRTTVWHNLGAVAGLVLIVTAAEAFSETTPFPGWRALLPIGGTLALIASAPRARVSRALSWHPLVYVGLISYPLYLWHWPALSLATIVNDGLPPSWEIRAALLVLSGALSVLTFERLEKRIRWRRRGPGPVVLVASLAVASVAGVVVWAGEGLPARVQRAATFDVNRHAARDGDFEAPGTMDCRSTYERSPGAFCRTVSAPSVAILGDSHAMRLFIGFVQSADPVFSRAMAIGREACAPGAIGAATPGCTESIAQALRVIERVPTVSAVVVTAAADPDAVGAGLVRLLRDLLDSGHRVYYVADVPLLPFDPDTCIAARPFRPLAAAHRECAFPRAILDTARRTYNLRMDELRRALPPVAVFDPVPLFCDAEVCRAMVGDRLQYRDRDHLSRYGASRVARAFLGQVR